MLDPNEYKQIMKKLVDYSYETEPIAYEEEHTYSPSYTVVDLSDIKEILEQYVLPF